MSERPQLGLYHFIDHILSKDLKKVENISAKFISHLKKDFNNIYSLVDKDVSIKCVFNQDGIKGYLAGRNNPTPFDNLDGKKTTLMNFRTPNHFD